MVFALRCPYTNLVNGSLLPEFLRKTGKKRKNAYPYDYPKPRIKCVLQKLPLTKPTIIALKGTISATNLSATANYKCHVFSRHKLILDSIKAEDREIQCKKRKPLPK